MTATCVAASRSPMREPMRPNSEHCDELALAAVPNAVQSTCSMIQHNVSRWRIHREFGARIEWVARELVAHAVATTGVAEKAPLYTRAFDRLNILVVRLCEYDDRVMVEVWDRGNQPPPPSLAESASIAVGVDDWDYALPGPELRVVWCVLTSEPALPRREPRSNPPPLRNPLHDTAFLLRVMQGISRIE